MRFYVKYASGVVSCTDELVMHPKLGMPKVIARINTSCEACRKCMEDK